MALEKDLKTFKKYCSKCEGSCCYSETGEEIVPLSKIEADRLKRDYPEVKISFLRKASDAAIYYFYVPKEGCHFLKNHRCILGDKKPLNCWLFPIIFQYKSKVKFIPDEAETCPYVKELTSLKDWKKKVTLRAEKELKNWTKEELKFFSDYLL
jgi:Fe-S-cluster containining protein